MASGGRLKAWLIIPPLLIVGLGLSSNAWRQRSHWELQKARALSEVLPAFITARKDVMGLIDGFKQSSAGEIGSEDQLISFLQDMAQQNEFLVDTVNVITQKNQRQPQQKAIPVLNAVVRGSGDLAAIQLYINQVKTQQRLLSVSSLRMSPPKDAGSTLYDAEIIFELILLDELQTAKGGAQ